MDPGRILVTGGDGFVGRALLTQLHARGWQATGTSRRLAPGTADSGNLIASGDLERVTDWRPLLEGHAVVVHTAARVHLLRDRARDPLAAYRAANTAATLRLAQAAAAAGVRRFVFVSSVKVLGEATAPGRPFTAASPLAPADPYAVSKAEAERGLGAIAQRTGMELVVVRPPLVYGPGVRANFRRLLTWVDRGVPLPLGGLDNRRSLLALDNLVDLLAHCCVAPAAAGATLLASDGEDLSTSELLQRIGTALGRPARLLPASPRLLALASRCGAAGAVARLTGSLQVDSSAARSRLDWQPPLSVDAGLAAVAAWYREQRR